VQCAQPSSEKTTCEVVFARVKNTVGYWVEFGRVDYAHYLRMYSLVKLAEPWETTYDSIDGHNLTEDNAGGLCSASSSVKL